MNFFVAVDQDRSWSRGGIRVKSWSCAGVLRSWLAQTLRSIFRRILRVALRHLARLIFRWLIFSLKYSRRPGSKTGGLPAHSADLSLSVGDSFL